jgi:predicted lipoprotein with Yx(FWY)xxD motif
MTNLLASRKVPLAVRVGGSLAAAAVLTAACGSSGTKPAALSASSAPAAAGGSPSVSAVDVRTAQGSTFLTDHAGRALYLWVPDTSMASKCSGACANAWPPLTAKGAPTAGPGATAGELGTISRSDGTKQVTYAGHPLYYFAGDSGAGQTNGEGSKAFGAPWYLVAPSGQQITSLSAAASTPAPTKAPASSSSSSGAGGGWS